MSATQEPVGSGRLGPELVEAYAATVIDIELPEGTVTLTPAADAPALQWPGGLQLPLHVITAWNPGSVPLSRDRNERRQSQLGEQLQDLADEVHGSVGRAADGHWAEPSFAVTGLDRTVACAIGQRAGQLAVFEIGVDVAIVSCREVQVVHRFPARSTTHG